MRPNLLSPMSSGVRPRTNAILNPTRNDGGLPTSTYVRKNLMTVSKQALALTAVMQPTVYQPTVIPSTSSNDGGYSDASSSETSSGVVPQSGGNFLSNIKPIYLLLAAIVIYFITKKK